MIAKSIIFCLAFSISLSAAPRYFATIFGVQDAVNSFTRAHTFAHFVEVDSGTVTRFATISWLPKSGKVVLFVPPETGRNHSLKESLDEPSKDGRRITKWGPFAIRPELFSRAERQQRRLELGEILYQAFDELNREEQIALNCEHSVSDIDTDGGLLFTGTAHGNRGSRLVARHLRRWYLSEQTHQWVSQLMGLYEYDIDEGKFHTNRASDTIAD